MPNVFTGFQDNIRRSLAGLLLSSPSTPLRHLIFAVLFILITNVAGNALDKLLDITFFSSIILLVILVFLVALLVSWRNFRLGKVVAPKLADSPPRVPGLILLLSTLYSKGEPKAKTLSDKPWTVTELDQALHDSSIGWPMIIKRFSLSNMEPMIEAINHHYMNEDGEQVLQDVWLISTSDQVDELGNIVQLGSQSLAPLFAKVITEGLGYKIRFHFIDPRLIVPSFEIHPTYEALEFIFKEDAPGIGLAEEYLIADVTGGRVPMGLGIALLCAPNGWPMQYTTTIVDPQASGPGGKPVPREIVVDTRGIIRNAVAQSLEQF